MGPYQAHPVKAFQLVRDGFPGGADHFRKVRVGQRQAEHDPAGSFHPEFTAYLKEDLCQPLIGPGVSEFRNPLLDLGQAPGQNPDEIQADPGNRRQDLDKIFP